VAATSRAMLHGACVLKDAGYPAVYKLSRRLAGVTRRDAAGAAQEDEGPTSAGTEWTFADSSDLF
jgi:hypothetical protein